MQERAPWLIANRYEVGEVVGRGGYGMVCRGTDRLEGRPVALKMLSPEAGRDPDVVERMLREQQALVALSGTCAVTAIDLCRLDSGAPCLVMEWLDGRDLEQELSAWEARDGFGSVEGLRRSLEPLTQTLARAHELGLVHRDIKPANIFVTAGPDSTIRLLDFGLSRMKSAAPLTQLGMVMGSPSYIAPETWRGNSSALDGRADLFSLAVIVFRWLTGKLPFDAPDLIGKMTAVTSGPRPSVLALRPELPASLDGWMARALAVEPDARFQTAQEFYESFVAALNGVVPMLEASGIRVRAEVSPGESAPSEGPLVAAFRRAASLLKRFTGARDSPVPAEPAASASAVQPVAPSSAPNAPPPPPPTPKASVPPPLESQRPSIWLDSSELEDAVESVRAPALEDLEATAALPTPAEGTLPEPETKAKAKGKAKGKGKGKAKSKGKGASKQPSDSKPKAKAASGSGKKSGSKRRKARKQ
jgi:serine/threonine-protein kinase